MIVSIKHLLKIAGASAVLVLGGCVTVHTVDVDNYDPVYVGYAAQAGAMPLEIVGNPFGSTDADNSLLVDALSMPAWHGTQKFRQSQRTDDKWSNTRVVLFFDAADHLTAGKDLCEGVTGTTHREIDHINVRAAFCAGDKTVSSAIGTGVRPKSPDDIEFQSLMDTVFASMLPHENPNRGQDCQVADCG